jgi:hypothetical protein
MYDVRFVQNVRVKLAFVGSKKFQKGRGNSRILLIGPKGENPAYQSSTATFEVSLAKRALIFQHVPHSGTRSYNLTSLFRASPRTLLRGEKGSELARATDADDICINRSSLPPDNANANRVKGYLIVKTNPTRTFSDSAVVSLRCHFASGSCNRYWRLTRFFVHSTKEINTLSFSKEFPVVEKLGDSARTKKLGYVASGLLVFCFEAE